MAPPSSVVVNDLDVGRTGIGPAKTDPKLIVDPDAVLPLPVALPGLQPVARGHLQVLQDVSLVEPVLDYLCQVADLREIYFLWRPFLRDPGDEMVLEVTVGAQASRIVTHNVWDFQGVEAKFGNPNHGAGRVPDGGTKEAMSTLSLRLPKSLHERARVLAEQEGVSINQLIATALAEKISAWTRSATSKSVPHVAGVRRFCAPWNRHQTSSLSRVTSSRPMAGRVTKASCGRGRHNEGFLLTR